MLYQAPYVLPITALPIPQGAILVRQGLIVDIGPQAELHSRYPAEEVTTFPSAAILPGLVNPHIHLELTNLAGRISRGTNFAAWIAEIIRLRSEWDENHERASIQRGVQECLAHGITCVGDISRSGLSAKILAAAGLPGVVFLETLGFQEDKAPGALSRLEDILMTFPKATDLRAGLSPHAPYSTAPGLYRKLTEKAGSYPLCTHLAETQEEVEFLLAGTGALHKLLHERGAWEPGWQVPKASPIEYLNRIGALQHGLLAVHLNYLTREDINTLAQTGVQAVVCPGSNQWFGRHNPHLPKLLAAGINLSLATDSLASNESLDMFREMRLCHQAYPDINPDVVLKMGTINGAKALGSEHRTGSLEINKRADLVVVGIPAKIPPKEISEYMVTSDPPIVQVLLAGNPLKIQN
jgi:cytosine/adenosine deaminase-related metal-dependent hydrolase